MLSAVLALAFACRLDKLVDTPRPPGLGVAPSRIAESADSGSGDVRAVALTVSSSQSRVITWTAHSEAGAAWLALTDASGSTPDTLRFTLDPSGLDPGTYSDAIIVVPDDAAAARVRVPVELRIDPVAAGTGDLSVRVGTSGGAPDADGYTVTIDGGQTRAVAINDTTTYTGLAARSYTVQLGGLASNCTVPAGATRTVPVSAGQTATVTFAVTCPTTPPPTGDLRVITSTTGATPDPNGYTVTIDGGQSQTLTNNDTTTYTLAAGTYTVALGDVASNCTVSGGPSQTKAVTAGQTVTAAFTVTCSTTPPPTGDLTVTTSTTGSSLDPDGYTVAVDGGTPQAIATNNSTGITFTGLTATNHAVLLGGVAANCTVTGGPSQTVAVPSGGTATLGYAVTCTTTPPPTGTLTVSASTTPGGTPDPNGYSVTVDGGQLRSIGINGSTTYTLAPASYTVDLGDIATNCTVSGGTSRTVTVTAGQPTSVPFTVDCPTPPPPTGTLTVSASTTPGGTPDPNGYTVTVDGGQLRSIGSNGSTTYTLAPASYTVDLGDIATNCTVSGGTSRTVTVTAGQATQAPFTVDCPTPPPPTGDLIVGATTTGGTPDPNGYTVTVDGAQLRTIGNNGSTPYTGLTPGSHVVVLGDIASNCTVSGGASHTVTVVAGQTTTETFAVDCPTPPPPNQAPRVNAGPDQNALLSALFTLGASFSDPDNGPWSFTIDWGDGTSSSGNASSPGAINGTHTYLLPGSYRIGVTVRDSRGATGSDEMILTVTL